jgi:hypothetical protein
MVDNLLNITEAREEVICPNMDKDNFAGSIWRF